MIGGCQNQLEEEERFMFYDKNKIFLNLRTVKNCSLSVLNYSFFMFIDLRIVSWELGIVFCIDL